MEVSSPPRRMPPAERREQLIDAAVSIAAQDGYENVAFEAVANRASVTRNLVYHYFPGGRQQLIEAAAHRAGEGGPPPTGPARSSRAAGSPTRKSRSPTAWRRTSTA